ncbi:MAG: hypothetical protein ACXW3E_08150 [Thermoanaerobaculia bacterium]
MRPDIDPLLQRLLHESESLLRTFVACSPAPLLERSILGSGLQHLRRCIVAVTTGRIVMIAVHLDLTPRGALSQISWGDVKSFSIGSIRRTLVLQFRNGRRQRFTDLTFADVQALRDMLPPLIGHGPMTAAKERESLCARCLATLRPGSPVCTKCQAPRKSRSHAAKLAWWSAGGGYHYLGFTRMAVLTGLVELCFLAVFVVAAVAAFQRNGLSGAIAFVCLTILFLEWKTIVVAHTASLANETTIDLEQRRPENETLFDIMDDSVRWIYSATRRERT